MIKIRGLYPLNIPLPTSDFRLPTSDLLLVFGQIWDEHLYFDKARIEGKTQIGKATAKLLQFNIPNRMLQRQVLMSQQQYP